MANSVTVNPTTGQIAILRDDGWHIYDPGMYAVNQKTGQIAIPDAKTKSYEIHDVPGVVTKLGSPDAILARQTGQLGTAPTGLSQGEPAPDVGTSLARQTGNALSFGVGPLASTEGAALANTINGVPAPVDPQHPVTGGMTTGFGANMRNIYPQVRQEYESDFTTNPLTSKLALAGGSLLAGSAMGAKTLWDNVLSGAGQGGLLSYGFSDATNPKSALLNTLIGMGGGAAGGAAGSAVSRVLSELTPSGLAYKSLAAAAPTEGDIGSIQVRPSSMPAELDPGMTGLLQTAGQKNGAAAAEAIPAVRDRLAAVNDAIVGKVNSELSPEDAALLGQRITDQAKVTNRANYAAAYANPATVGLTPEITTRPSFNDALVAAKAAAADEYPPRTLDPTNLTAKDIDLIDRVLSSTQKAATDSRGDTSTAAQVAKATIPTRGEVANDVRSVADSTFPELAKARAGAEEAFGLKDAIDLGGTWLSSGKSAEQVGVEFRKLTPAQQNTALAGFATDIRNMLSTKTAKANLGQVFERTGLADKLREIGISDDVVMAITKGGQGAKNALAALEGGSMTARNLAGAQAMRSAFSNVNPSDFVAGALMGRGSRPVQIASSIAFPFLRGMTARAERNAAGEIVNALTTPGAAGLANVINRAPQANGSLLTTPFRVGGGLLDLLLPNLGQNQ